MGSRRWLYVITLGKVYSMQPTMTWSYYTQRKVIGTFPLADKIHHIGSCRRIDTHHWVKSTSFHVSHLVKLNQSLKFSESVILLFLAFSLQNTFRSGHTGWGVFNTGKLESKTECSWLLVFKYVLVVVVVWFNCIRKVTFINKYKYTCVFI